MSGFGAGFKKAREALGITIDGVASETRIGARFLRAIESEEFDQLPGGIFNRGFIRSYAERLGLDPDQAVEDYERLIHTRETAEEEPASYRPARSGAPVWAILVGIAIVLLLVASYFFVNRKPDPAVENRPSSPPVLPLPEKTQKPPEPAPTATVPPTPTPPPTPTVPEKPPEPVAPKSPLDIELRISEATWVQVAVDGVGVEAAVLQAGDTRHYTGKTAIMMVLGNAGGLTMKLNEREISSLGKRGEVRQFTITPENAAQFGSN